MWWKVIATNADFWSQVLQNKSLQPLDFALGAVMATRKEHLEKIGGFETLADYLADDFQLGNRIWYRQQAPSGHFVRSWWIACHRPPELARMVISFVGRTIRVPAGAIRVQHFEQCHALAAALGRRPTGQGRRG